MKTLKKSLAVTLCAALAVTAVPAQAAVTLAPEQPDATVNRSSATEPFINGSITPRGGGRFDYSHPASQADNHQFATSIAVRTNGDAAVPELFVKPQVSTDGTADVLVYTQRQTNFLITRTYRIDGGRVDATVTVHNTGQAPGDVSVELANALPVAAGLRANRQGNRITVEPKAGGYITNVTFADPDAMGAGATQASALAAAGDGAKHQAASWDRTLDPGTRMSASMTVDITPQDSVLDSDGDGLRDSWETNGIVLEDGTALPIHRWGVDPDRKDLFLQVNWMESEWKTLGCDRKERFAASVEGFAEFAECANANTKNYAPNTSMFKELEALFDDNGINLHIDAGKTYVSDSMASATAKERKGGETLQYEAEYFGGLDDWGKAEKLEEQAESLLGPRRAVFRNAVIGTRFDHGAKKNVTGLGQVNGSTFFVSGDVTNSDELLRNTILHEFGHTLGLAHWGRELPDNTAQRYVHYVNTNDPSDGFDRPGYDWLSNYKSTMSYAYQFSEFDFSAAETRASERIPNRVDTSVYKPADSTFDYVIPSDWDNLLFKTDYIGKGVRDFDGAAEAPDVRADEERAEVDELITAAAASGKNDGKVGFSLARYLDNDNGIVTQAPNNVIKGELRNLGSTDDTFTVVADYGAGEFRDDYFAKGNSNFITPVDIEVSPAVFIDNPVVPINITVFNSEGAQVFADTFKVSALQYSRAEMDKVLAEVLASDADESLKAFARERLKAAPVNTPTVSAKPAPVPAKPSPSNEPSGSSASPVAIVIGVLLGLIGLGAAGFGWAQSQGLIPSPF
ncbi:hypothetical protein GC584_04610 [Corynebacterium sp. zg912]|uniref:Uncharacterized protein n=1 Tax=Corynebacterium wankanglinii TaxID=2735136 RepID=A0A7H0KBN7_9CORY|nr:MULTISPECIES: M66 family metalloprotease [Corynebacterium]MBA1837451.1 hypothetical protein [Corynebacterium wankanglinii]MCR5928713.1 hypothetical protein [Corynebacterium sp. zg912]QNP94703.1 hypothetical protein IA203_04220 [Corynebacterium wankanglinii]